MRRSGLSLTEVLIAVFCMAIGMISLLALFPIGMLNMSASIRNNRQALAADNAISIFDTFARNDPRLRPEVSPGLPNTSSPFRTATDSAGNLIYWDLANNQWRFSRSSASPFLLLDPMGHVLSPGWPTGYRPVGPGYGPIQITRPGFGTQNSVGVTRIGAHPTIVPNLSAALRWCTQEDEVTFGQDGVPASGVIGGVTMERERKYSWAYLVRLPRFDEPDTVEVSIILFSGRRLTGIGIGTPIPEQTVGATAAPPFATRVFTQGSRSAVVYQNDVAGGKLALKPGYWVLDTTVIPGTFANGYADAQFNGYFYQVVGVSDPDPAGQILLELDRPAQADGFVGTFLYGVSAIVKRSN